MKKLIKIIFVTFLFVTLIGATSRYVLAKYIISEHKEITMIVKSSHEDPITTSLDEGDETDAGTGSIN